MTDPSSFSVVGFARERCLVGLGTWPLGRVPVLRTSLQFCSVSTTHTCTYMFKYK